MTRLEKAKKDYERHPVSRQEVVKIPGQIIACIRELNFLGEFTGNAAKSVDAERVAELIVIISKYDYRMTNAYFRKQFGF